MLQRCIARIVSRSYSLASRTCTHWDHQGQDWIGTKGKASGGLVLNPDMVVTMCVCNDLGLFFLFLSTPWFMLIWACVYVLKNQEAVLVKVNVSKAQTMCLIYVCKKIKKHKKWLDVYEHMLNYRTNHTKRNFKKHRHKL